MAVGGVHVFGWQRLAAHAIFPGLKVNDLTGHKDSRSGPVLGLLLRQQTAESRSWSRLV
jgi:hypothetical protein